MYNIKNLSLNQSSVVVVDGIKFVWFLFIREKRLTNENIIFFTANLNVNKILYARDWTVACQVPYNIQPKISQGPLVYGEISWKYLHKEITTNVSDYTKTAREHCREDFIVCNEMIAQKNQLISWTKSWSHNMSWKIKIIKTTTKVVKLSVRCSLMNSKCQWFCFSIFSTTRSQKVQGRQAYILWVHLKWWLGCGVNLFFNGFETKEHDILLVIKIILFE